MYVCICKGVTHRMVRRTIEQGARTVEEVGMRCGAGTSCGSCKPKIVRMLADDEQEREAEPLAAK